MAGGFTMTNEGVKMALYALTREGVGKRLAAHMRHFQARGG